MIGKTVRTLFLLTAAMGVAPIALLAAEPLPPRALARIGDHRFYHGPRIDCAVLSPDGRRAASAAQYPRFFHHVSDKERDAYDRVIVLWDAATGERLRELRVPRGVVGYLVFSRDGKQLAAAYTVSDKAFGIAVFAVESGKLLWQRGDFKHRAEHLQYSADGKQLRVSEWLGPVSAWNAASGKQLRLWKPPPEVPPKGDKVGVRGLRGLLSPDGKVIAWTMGLFHGSDNVLGLAGLRVHDAATDKLLYHKELHDDWQQPPFAFSLDGQLFTADGDKLTVWESATGKRMLVLDVPEMLYFVLAPDGRRAAVYRRVNRVRLWDVETRKPAQDLCAAPVSLPYLVSRSQVFSADGKLLLLSTDSTLRLFETAAGKERLASEHRTAITPRFSSDGRTLITSCLEWRCRWDVSAGKEPALRRREPKKSWEAECLAYSADGRLLLDSSEGKVRMRETATGRVLHELRDSFPWFPFHGCFSPDATSVLLAYRLFRGPPTEEGTDRYRLYDVKTGKVLNEMEQLKLARGPLFSPNGCLVAWQDDAGTIHLHDAATGKVRRTLKSPRPLPESEDNRVEILFSSDGDYLISGSNYLIRVFRISSGREIRRFSATAEKTRKGARLSCMARSPDDRILAVAEVDSGIVRLFELASGKVRAEFAGHHHGVHGLDFAPDGKTLASGGEDNVVFLWDVAGAKTLATSNKVSDNDLSSLWHDLASEDGKRAGDAIAAFLRKPEAGAAFLQEHLHPAEAPEAKRLAQWIAELDDAAFDKREAASRELTQMGERAEAALRRALTSRPTLEARRRMEDILNKLEPTPPPTEILRALRAIEVLEHVGTPAARRCLEALVKGEADARQTRDAKAALRRLSNKR